MSAVTPLLIFPAGLIVGAFVSKLLTAAFFALIGKNIGVQQAAYSDCHDYY